MDLHAVDAGPRRPRDRPHPGDSSASSPPLLPWRAALRRPRLPRRRARAVLALRPRLRGTERRGGTSPVGQGGGELDPALAQAPPRRARHVGGVARGSPPLPLARLLPRRDPGVRRRRGGRASVPRSATTARACRGCSPLSSRSHCPTLFHFGSDDPCISPATASTSLSGAIAWQAPVPPQRRDRRPRVDNVTAPKTRERGERGTDQDGRLPDAAPAPTFLTHDRAGLPAVSVKTLLWRRVASSRGRVRGGRGRACATACRPTGRGPRQRSARWGRRR